MQYADLVLEGGGVKGIALVGAISVLEEAGFSFKRVAGTSAGAIVGALTAAGFSAAELESIMRAVDYTKFEDGSRFDSLLIGKATDLLLHQGIYDGDYLKAWLGDQLAERNIKTFADLAYQDDERPLPPEQAYRLVVMTSDITAGCLRRMPWDYDHYELEGGRQPVVDAVRMSMSIPFFYRPVELETAGRKKWWFVDGGMLSNFPIDVFDAPSGQEPRWPTFGLKLSSRPGAVTVAANQVHDTLSMSLALVNTMTGFYDRMHIDDPDVVKRTIFIDTGGVKATDFHLDHDTQNMLFENGRAAARKFLHGGDGQEPWDWEKYKERRREGAAKVPGSRGVTRAS